MIDFISTVEAFVFEPIGYGWLLKPMLGSSMVPLRHVKF